MIHRRSQKGTEARLAALFGVAFDCSVIFCAFLWVCFTIAGRAHRERACRADPLNAARVGPLGASKGEVSGQWSEIEATANRWVTPSSLDDVAVILLAARTTSAGQTRPYDYQIADARRNRMVKFSRATFTAWHTTQQTRELGSFLAVFGRADVSLTAQLRVPIQHGILGAQWIFVQKFDPNFESFRLSPGRHQQGTPAACWAGGDSTVATISASWKSSYVPWGRPLP
jgi:hypothetical protein